MEVRTGPSGPVFFIWLLIGLLISGCASVKTQPPTIDLERVHSRGAHRIAFDPRGDRLASGGLHGSIHIWEVETGRLFTTLTHHASSIRGLAWLDDTALISADKDGKLTISDLRTLKVSGSAKFGSAINFALSPDRSWLLLAEKRQIRKLALPSFETLEQLSLDADVLAVAINQAGSRMAVSTDNSRVMLMDSDLGGIAELPRPSRDAYDLRFSPDNSILLAGGWFKLLVWDFEKGVLQERSTEHLGQVVAVDISPDGSRWISLGRETDSSFRLIDAESNQVVRRFEAHELCGRQARFSADGRYVASSADDGSIHIYDLDQPYRPVVRYIEYDD